MRAISEELQSHLDTKATTICRCWKILRTDETEFGFTDHDEDINFDGSVFAAGSGLTSHALQTSSGLSVDNSAVSGALSAECITETDIQAGRFDGAEIWHWNVNWQEPEQRVLLFRGNLGEIRRGESGFEVELRGLSQKLNLPVGRRYLRQCSAQLGDASCGVDLNDPSLKLIGQIKASSDRIVFKTLNDGMPDGWYSHGTVKWTSGTLEGLTSGIASDQIDGDDRLIILASETPFDLEEFMTFEITAGCDKLAASCQNKFNNFLNFQGFPYIPGEDWLTAYPIQGENSDGGSLFGGGLS